MRKNNRLPNFKNLGIILRILLIVNALCVLAAALLSPSLAKFAASFVSISAVATPLLLASLVVLYAATPFLNRLNYLKGLALIGLIVLVSTSLLHFLIAPAFATFPSLLRTLFFALMICAICLYYFDLLQRAYSPAVAEARLQALQARIRPHFLFNSINAVLSLIRSQPQQAETALEDMADLFRVLMADNRELVPLASEIALCRQYLALEKLRLEERLNVDWQLDTMPPDALIPPLILQPLLENAVYHGIEPLAAGGTILVRIYTERNVLHIVLSNPYSLQSTHQHGNKMALKNIQERLLLHFDLEAQLKSTQDKTSYSVHITLPHTK